MKSRLITVICAVVASLTLVSSCKADIDYDPAVIAADALVARPACFVATIIGSVVFVIALPVAATSGSIHSAAEALVAKPAWATFRRPLGDFGYAEEYVRKYPGKQEPRRVAHMSKRAKTKKQ